MRIFIVRHLPTHWNIKRLLQGREDVDILEPDYASNAQIRANKIILTKYEPFDMVLTSALKRTQQTACLYGFKEYKVEPLLDELDFGTYAGKSKGELYQGVGWGGEKNYFATMLSDEIIDLECRIKKFLVKYNKYHKLLVFGHGSWIRGLVSIINYGDINKMNTFYYENNHLISIAVNFLSRVLTKTPNNI